MPSRSTVGNARPLKTDPASRSQIFVSMRSMVLRPGRPGRGRPAPQNLLSPWPDWARDGPEFNDAEYGDSTILPNFLLYVV
jgi:hypothetical protein